MGERRERAGPGLASTQSSSGIFLPDPLTMLPKSCLLCHTPGTHRVSHSHSPDAYLCGPEQKGITCKGISQTNSADYPVQTQCGRDEKHLFLPFFLFFFGFGIIPRVSWKLEIFQFCAQGLLTTSIQLEELCSIGDQTQASLLKSMCLVL